MYRIATILITAGLVTGICKQSLSQSSDSSNITTSQLNHLEVSVKVYPNPASKAVTFSFVNSDLQLIKVKVFEITGLEISSFIPSAANYVFDVSALKEGLYFYSVLNNGKVIQSEKFVVLKK